MSTSKTNLIITSPAISSPLVASSTSASSTLSVSSNSSATPTPITFSASSASSALAVSSDSFALAVSSDSSATPASLTPPGRLEDTVKGLRNDISRSSEWTERTIGIHERRQPRQASPYSSNTALTPSPQRIQHHLSGSISPTASQHSIMSFNGVTTSTPREEL
ncbi:hypothetical protein K457DRAFT_1894528 [Linnemannia elongata AG-77]|uniref:Uncharacterized protein n=1 Tax=Linnemannia elongata AG-77 TaxID=1314771 RepID=A0A197JR92_9FUNG|nr:hypothetical protein K457DRAFT_1894528 [Linnemannia elongata AG-77]